MRAWVGDDALGSFRLAELPEPAPGPGELVVEVRAAGINRVDQRPKTSHFAHSAPAPAPVPGLEAAGEVVAVGSGVTGFGVGDRVTAMVQGGCAERVRVHADLAIRIPGGMTWTMAAALPVSYLTAHDALVTSGRFPRGGSVLIHAVSSGVGIAALQLARLREAAVIAGTSGSAAKLERLRTLGLTLGLARPEAGFSAAVLDQTGGAGIDVVIDNVGGALLNETLRATALGGRVIDVGRLGGTDAAIDLNLLALRRITLIGVTFRTRSLAEHAGVVRAFLADHDVDLANGRLTPLIDRVFPFAELPAAIARGGSREQLGKIVVEH